MRHVQQLPRTGLIGQHKRRIARGGKEGEAEREKKGEKTLWSEARATSLIESNENEKSSRNVQFFNVQVLYMYHETKKLNQKISFLK